MQNINKKSNHVIKNVIIRVVTPLFAPSLSPNKYMKKMQINDLKRCYPEEVHELLEHVDKAFDRDDECNALLPSSTISAGIREQYPQYAGISVSGIIIFSKDFIRIGTKKAGNSLMSFEYLVPGAMTQATLAFSQDIKLPIILRLGYRKNKGYGIIKLTEA